MARSLALDHDEKLDLHRALVDYYRERLSRPPVFPWEGSPYPPVTIGPTWQTTEDGKRWLLPEKTLGWDVLADAGVWLEHSPGEPWRFTDEQARWLLWWFAVDDEGRFLFRDGILQRLKGWGKDPLAAALSWTEFAGPARFYEWRSDGSPAAMDVPDAWIQIAAVSLEQTKNTMRLFPALLSGEAQLEHSIQIGKELIHGFGDRRLIQAVTSSPATLEGARSTFVLMNETHHWTASNSGHDMADVIERNTTKAPDASARTLAITNAYDPSQDSVAQQAREAWEAIEAGRTLSGGVLYDSLEAPSDAPMTAEAAPAIVASIRGDSTWLDVRRIVDSILDPRNSASRSRRWWFNQIQTTDDAWLEPADIDATARPDLELADGDVLALFFDGGKSDDSSALVGCRVADGHVFTLGIWQKPPGARGEGWVVNRDEVDQKVREIPVRFDIAAFFADPSHAKDDEDSTAFWAGYIDGWHRDFGETLDYWAVQAGPDRHSILWDMSSPSRLKQFTKAAERFEEETRGHAISHDGHPALVSHLRNARRYPNRFGVSIWKGHRESSRKIDLAVAAVGARMVRRLVLNRGEKKGKKKPGKVW